VFSWVLSLASSIDNLSLPFAYGEAVLLALRLKAKLPSPNVSSVLSNSLTGVSGLPEDTVKPGGRAAEDACGKCICCLCRAEVEEEGSDTGGVGGAITFANCDEDAVFVVFAGVARALD